MKPAAFVLFASLAALAACGDRADEAGTPAGEPVAEAPPADTITPPPVAEAPPVDVAPAAQALPDTPSAAPPPAAPPAATAPTVPSPATRPDSTIAAPTPKAEPAPPPAVTAEAPPPAADTAHGEQVYRKSCAFCHDRGTAGAPKLGDVQAWTPRIAQGVEVLYTNSIKGIRAMPPKGGNPTLSESDVKAAVDYLVAKAR